MIDSDPVKNLRIMFNSDHSFKINILAITAYYHLRNISKVHYILSPSDNEKLVHAFCTSRLDYCNSVFVGLLNSSMKHLQRLQNAAPRMLLLVFKGLHGFSHFSSKLWISVPDEQLTMLFKKVSQNTFVH